MVCLLSTSETLSPRARGERERSKKMITVIALCIHVQRSILLPMSLSQGGGKRERERGTKTRVRDQRPYSREVDVDDEASAGEVSATMVLYDGGNRGASPAVRGM